MNSVGGKTLTAIDVAPTRLPLVAWASLLSACLGWMFDAFDMQLFTVILFPSVSELIGSNNPGVIAYTGGIIMAAKLIAWGLGGIVFGVIADRIGRSRAMIFTVLIYSIFCGLSALAQTWWQLALLQMLSGIGIGGEWAAGSALIAETWPEKTRQRALQVMQMTFALGFFLAGAAAFFLAPFGWRWVLALGVVPAFITLFIRQFVPEPERWKEARARREADARNGKSDSAAATFLAIFQPPLRRRTIVGVLIAATMMIGSLGTTALLPVWIRQFLPPDQAPLTGKFTGQAFMMMNIGAICCYTALIWLMDWLGRRWCYFLVMIGAATTNIFMFTHIATIDRFMLIMVVYGFFAVGGFGSFASYLPELFPTRFRTTGQGFCWNMGRTLTAIGPFSAGLLVSTFGSVPKAGLWIATIYIVGMVTIWFGPETKGKPLED
jgi:MFS family permease